MMNFVTHHEEAMLEANIDGDVTIEDIKEMERLFEELRAAHKKVKMLFVVKNASIKGNALIADVRFDVKNWRHFDKIAVVSDKRSVAVVTRLMSKLPKTDMKHYSLSDIREATTWLQT